MSATAARPNFAFVAASHTGKPADVDRKLIRSHCMKGKNKKRRGQLARPNLIGASYGTQHATLNLLSPITGCVHTIPGIRSPIPLHGTKTQEEEQYVVSSSQATREELFRLEPPPTDLSLVNFAAEVDGQSRALLFKYYAKARAIAYPVDFFVDFEDSKVTWFQWLSCDAMYLYCVLLSTSALNDFVMQQPFASNTYFYLRKTITSLNEYLSDSATSLKDSTFAVVIALASLSSAIGDHTAASTHITGLQEMVRLRGGPEAFLSNPKLHIKICRLDLALCLNTGKPPYFFRNPVSWSPVIENLVSSLSYKGFEAPARTRSIDGLVDDQLIAIFYDLQCFSDVLNFAIGTNKKVKDVEFLNVLYSTQYRLLQLQLTPSNILGECLRLAMLAILTTAFQTPGTKARYPFLADKYRDYCCALDFADPRVRDMIIWFLMIGCVSLYDADEPWLQKRWLQAVPQSSWPEARENLQQYIWVSKIHDEIGNRVFDLLSQC